VPVAHACNQSGSRPYLEKPFTKIGLVEWIKVKALSSSSSTAKSKTEQQKS
jgi:FixJ family two-component response regulator